MRRFIEACRTSFSRDPAPWLLIMCAFLALIFWNLPVPPFLFAQAGGSTSTSECPCQVDDKCVPWTKTSDNCTTVQPWEDCIPDAQTTKSCNGEQHVPGSRFVYEKQGHRSGWCSNVQEHQQTQDSHHITWKRQLSITANGAAGTKKIDFKPDLVVEFPGFTNGNVCIDSSGQIDIKSGFYAAMTVCGETVIDPDHASQDPDTTGWAFVTHTFKKDDQTGLWKFVQGSNPHIEKFQLSKTCNCNAQSDDPEQFIEFKSRVELNQNVLLGKLKKEAEVYYYLQKDDTTCNGQ